MMYEPGRYAGDKFDEQAVLQALEIMAPRTTEEWQRGILSQIHGDYATAVRQTIEFDPRIGKTAPSPEGEPALAAVGTNHFALVLDASGSMAEPSGAGSRLDEAKSALTRFVTALPDNATVSLRVYGHRGGNDEAGRSESCAATEIVYSDKADPARLAAALTGIKPTGWTPLASSIAAVAADIPANATDSIAYIVTDGLETCGGDPVRAAKELAGSGIKPIVNVVGFHAGDADRAALEAIAAAGNGTYTAASDTRALDTYLDAEYQRLMAAWNQWKQTELARITTEGTRKMTEADAIGKRIMEAANTEQAHANTVIEALVRAGKLNYDTKSAVWSHFYDRKARLWGYGYSTKSSNWSAAYTEKSTNWSTVYATATSRWSEYYTKSHN
ncbi:VWA domain-containing protein [Nocardia sp. NPDC050435]|uniref:VWA domain-containing protein n=1 Tax=Nocardia sp. NPDC050435 TaxID=3155040 RepID=UPI0033C87D79